MTDLKITKETSVQGIRAFLGGKAADGKLLAKKNSDGSQTLYVSQSGLHLKDRLTGARARQKEAARIALDKIFLAEATAQKASAPANRRQSVGKALSAAFSRIKDHRRGHGLRVDQLSVLAETHLAVAEGEALESKFGNAGGVPSVPMTISDEQKDTFAKIAEALVADRGQENGPAFIETLKQIAAQQSDGDRALALSSEVEFETFVLNALPDGARKKNFADSFSGPMLAAAHQAFASTVLDSLEIGQSAPIPVKDGAAVNLRAIRIGSIEYTPRRHLGTGGFAHVFEYVSAEDPNKKIAVKVPIKQERASADEKTAAQANCAAEALMHEKAAKSGGANVLGYVGAINSPENGLCIAVEIAPHGDVMEMAELIAKKVEDGELTPEQALAMRATLIQDLAKGLDALQTAGMFHGDFKPPNALIGEDGAAKISDFGNARLGKAFSYPDILENDNPRWLAREVLYAKDVKQQLGNLKHNKVGDKAKDLKNRFTALPGLSKTQTDSLTRAALRKEIKEPLYQNHKIGLEADSWALGISAYNIMTGQDWFRKESFTSMIADETQQFGQQGQMALAPASEDGTLPAGALGASTGDADVDAVINDLLRPTPTDRMTPEQVLRSLLFDRPGVGSDEARNLIMALHKGDQAAIKAAQAGLGAKLGSSG